MFRLDRFSAQYWWCNDALNNVLRLDVRWDGLSDFYSELSYKTEESDILAHRAIELVLLGHGLNTRSLFCTFFYGNAWKLCTASAIGVAVELSLENNFIFHARTEHNASGKRQFSVWKDLAIKCKINWKNFLHFHLTLSSL